MILSILALQIFDIWAIFKKDIIARPYYACLSWILIVLMMVIEIGSFCFLDVSQILTMLISKKYNEEF